MVPFMPKAVCTFLRKSICEILPKLVTHTVVLQILTRFVDLRDMSKGNWRLALAAHIEIERPQDNNNKNNTLKKRKKLDFAVVVILVDKKWVNIRRCRQTIKKTSNTTEEPFSTSSNMTSCSTSISLHLSSFSIIWDGEFYSHM